MINATSDIIEDNQANNSQKDMIESLLDSSSFDHEQRERILLGVNELTAEEASELIFKISQNQMDRISCGLPYNATDIKHHLKKLFR